jgi:RNA polymerase sigma factor (sigma-70 family)
MQSTDLQLYAQWRQQRNAAAFNELARRHAAMVFGACQRILRSAADAEEVAQECFETLATTTQGPDQNLGGWLHALATRRALNHLKSESRRREREQAFAEAHPTTAEVHWDDIYPLVDEAIAALPEKLREPLIRNFFEGQTHEAIAAELGVSRGAVTYRITQGVERIRKHLKRRGIVSGAVVLTAMLAENLANAETPATLTDAIARMALTGPPPVAASEIATMGSTALTWKLGASLLSAMVALAGIAVAWRFLQPEPGGVPLPPLTYDGATVSAAPLETETTLEPVPLAAIAPAPVSPAYTTVLAGRVVGTDGNPSAGATVTLERHFQPYLDPTVQAADLLPPFHVSLLTDDKGAFSFALEMFDQANTKLNGYHTFYMWAVKDEAGASILIHSGLLGPVSNCVELPLEPLKCIAGQVVDVSGSPVREFEMQVERRVGSDAYFEDWRTHEARISFGDRGEFSIEGLPSGRYTLRSTADGHAPGEVEAMAGAEDVRIELSAPLHISGIVRDRSSGRPVPGVKLVAFTRPRFFHTVQSDSSSEASGVFTLDGLQPELYYLLLKAANQPYTMEPLSQSVELSDGDSVDSLEITVYQGGTVSGRVVNARTGLTIPGGAVQASIPERPELEIGGSLGWRVPVDSDGRYKIEGLPRGSFAFIVEEKGAKSMFQEVYPGRLYDNVDVIVEPGISVAGQVLDLNGNGAANTIVIVEADSSRYPQQTRTDDAGNFVLWWKEEPMEAKTIRLQAMTYDTLSALTAEIPLNPKGVDGVVLRLEPAGVLEADVRYASGRPANGAKVVLAPQTPGVDVIGFHKLPNNTRAHYAGGLEATSTASGRVCLGPLPLGSYAVTAHPPGLDESNLVTTRTIQIGDEPASTQLTLHSSLHTRPAVVGQVTFAAAPVVGAQIGLSPLEPGQHGQWARSDAEGRYRFEEVPQVAARLRATYSPTGQSEVDSRVMEMGEIEIAVTGDTIADIAFGTGSATVEGTVMLGDQPLADISIGVHVRGGESVFTTTDPNGAFAVDAIAAGKITVNAMQGKKEDEGHWIRTIESELSPSERKRVDFSLGSGLVAGNVSGVAEEDSVIVAVVEGSLVAPTTLEDATIFVESEKIIARAEIDLTGVFQFNNIPQGTYTVVTVAMTLNENGDGLAENGFRAVGAEVVVEDGKVTEVTVALPDKNP